MRMKSFAISLFVMIGVSLVSLLILSLLVYILNWESDMAVLGITLTYILAGVSGGICLKILDLWANRKMVKENTLAKKILESFFLATAFVGGLCLISILVGEEGFEISKRFFLIWMLIIGSVSIARVL